MELTKDGFAEWLRSLPRGVPFTGDVCPIAKHLQAKGAHFVSVGYNRATWYDDPDPESVAKRENTEPWIKDFTTLIDDRDSRYAKHHPDQMKAWGSVTPEDCLKALGV